MIGSGDMENKKYERVEDVLYILSPDQLVVAADIYASGIMIKSNPFMARTCYLMAAEMGVPYAQYQVAMRLAEEEGALLWLHSSAKHGFPVAMKELSDRLRDIDPRASRKWLRKYYKCRNRIGKGQWMGRGFKNEAMPEVIDGSVVIAL
jgi:TPR repeat protein